MSRSWTLSVEQLLPQRAVLPTFIWAVTSQPIPTTERLLSGRLPAVWTERFLPWQERSSVSSLKPFLQLHSKLPMVFRQKCSQPPLWSSHSSISVGGQVRISLQHFKRTSCTNRLRQLIATMAHSLEVVCELAIWPLHVFPSGCSVKPTGQLQRTPVDVSLQVQSHPPLFTAQVSEITAHKENAHELPAFFGGKCNIIPQCQPQDP